MAARSASPPPRTGRDDLFRVSEAHKANGCINYNEMSHAPEPCTQSHELYTIAVEQQFLLHMVDTQTLEYASLMPEGENDTEN